MPTYSPSLDNGDVLGWPSLQQTDVVWRGLLLGNGASMAVWTDFAYPSLYDRARSNAVSHPLAASDIALFTAFGTTNFELVLESLKVADAVCRATIGEVPALRQRYESVQHALFQAVVPVHVPWHLAAARSLRLIREELQRYRWVYSTNYDLIVYWSIMHEHDEGDGFKDYFWYGSFNPADTGVSDMTATRVLYLHGGIHLRRREDGVALKRSAISQNLLDQLRIDFQTPETQLLVSEGTAADKERAIARSDYLSFAYRRLVHHDGPLVIFGHSLGQSDEHIVRAINSLDRPDRTAPIAISVRADSDEDRRLTKQAFAQRLRYADLYFFDADTHPLGESSVGVRVPFARSA